MEMIQSIDFLTVSTLIWYIRVSIRVSSNSHNLIIKLVTYIILEKKQANERASE